MSLFDSWQDLPVPARIRVFLKARLGPVFLCLALIFTTVSSIYFIRQEVMPFSPAYLDQDAYLKLAYGYSDLIQKSGVFETLRAHFLHDSKPLGFLSSSNSQMSLVASLLFPIFGENRLTALGIHLFSWALLLGTVYFVIQKITRQAGYGLAAVGFLLFVQMPHVGAGGMVDFRLDFVGACWIGISTMVWILFLHQPRKLFAWTATAAMAVLVFFRIITLAYLALPMAVLGFLIAHSLMTGKRQGLRHAFFPLVVFTVYAATLIYWDRAFLHFYYVQNQLGSEIVARGGNHTFDHIFTALSFYPLSLFENHFGPFQFYGLFAAAAASAAIYFLHLKRQGKTLLPIRRTAILFSFCAFIFPIVILTVNPTRTPQVVGASVVALAMSGFLVFLIFRPRQSSPVILILGSILLLAGCIFWIPALYAHAPYRHQRRADALVINSVFEKAFSELTRDPSKPSTFAVLDFNEIFISMGLYGREKLHSTQKVSYLFPAQIYRMEEADMLKIFHQARMAIIPRDPSIISKRPYPISQSISENYSAIKKDVEQRMVLLSSFTYEGVLYDIFISP